MLTEQLTCTLLLFTPNKHQLIINNENVLLNQNKPWCCWRDSGVGQEVVTRPGQSSRWDFWPPSLDFHHTERLKNKSTPGKDKDSQSSWTHTDIYVLVQVGTHAVTSWGNISTFRRRLSSSCCYSNFNGMTTWCWTSWSFPFVLLIQVSNTLDLMCWCVCSQRVWKSPAAPVRSGQKPGGNYCWIKNKTMWGTKGFMSV